MDLKSKLEQVIKLLYDGEIAAAREFFNENISDKYINLYTDDQSLFQLKMLLIEMGDYLNDPSTRIVNAISPEDLVRTFDEIKRDLETRNIW